MRKRIISMVGFISLMLFGAAAAIAAESADATSMASGTTQYKNPAFWIMIGSGVLGIIFTILGAFGYTKWAKHERFKLVMKVADNAISWFSDYAKKSDAKWDDIVVAILAAVAARLGELNDEEVVRVKKIITQRQSELMGKEDSDSKDQDDNSDK